MPRVVVTGVGAVAPIGLTAPDYLAALVEGRCAFAPPSFAGAESLSTRVVSEITGFEPRRFLSDRDVSRLDRVAQFAVVAAREAIQQSGLGFDGPLGDRTAAIVGTGVGGQTTLDESFRRVYAEGAKRLSALTIPRLMTSAAPSQVSMHFGIRGPAFAIASACASGTHAIGMGFHMVRSGVVDCAVVGGAEASISFGALRAWEALRIMAPDACRPFSHDRQGFVLGEGAAMLVLEGLDRARARGAAILGEIVGFGMSADARDLLTPDEVGATRAMAAALDDAGMNPAEVDYVNAHGTGTVANDAAETAAIKRALGAHASAIVLSSNKSMIGHALGAAGALEIAATLHTLATGVVPPTMGYLGPDPDCDLDCVPNESRTVSVRAALSNSFAFGGLNAVLAARRFDG